MQIVNAGHHLFILSTADAKDAGSIDGQAKQSIGHGKDQKGWEEGRPFSLAYVSVYGSKSQGEDKQRHP